MTEAIERGGELVALTADIVSAYVSSNDTRTDELPSLISAVHGALSSAGQPAIAEAPTKREPAVPIKKSITPDHLISLLDGRKYKSLKRHLSTQGFTPESYRAEFGLPSDYPMVAASYSAQRSSLAKSLGLGRREAAVEPVAEAAKPKAARTKKAA